MPESGLMSTSRSDRPPAAGTELGNGSWFSSLVQASSKKSEPERAVPQEGQLTVVICPNCGAPRECVELICIYCKGRL